MSADKEVNRTILMPLVNIPYEFEEVESAEDGSVRLERKKENLQKLLDEAVKAQGEPKAPERSRAEADDPGVTHPIIVTANHSDPFIVTFIQANIVTSIRAK